MSVKDIIELVGAIAAAIVLVIQALKYGPSIKARTQIDNIDKKT